MLSSKKNLLKWIYFIPATIIIIIGISWFWKWSCKSSVELFFLCISYADGVNAREFSDGIVKFLNNIYYIYFVEFLLAPLTVWCYLTLGNFLGPDSKNKKRFLEYFGFFNYILAIPIGISTNNQTLVFVSGLSVIFLIMFKDDYKLFNYLIDSIKSNNIFVFLGNIIQFSIAIYGGLSGAFLCYFIFLFFKNHSVWETLFFGPFVCAFKAIFWIFLL